MGPESIEYLLLEERTKQRSNLILNVMDKTQYWEKFFFVLEDLEFGKFNEMLKSSVSKKEREDIEKIKIKFVDSLQKIKTDSEGQHELAYGLAQTHFMDRVAIKNTYDAYYSPIIQHIPHGKEQDLITSVHTWQASSYTEERYNSAMLENANILGIEGALSIEQKVLHELFPDQCDHTKYLQARIFHPQRAFTFAQKYMMTVQGAPVYELEGLEANWELDKNLSGHIIRALQNTYEDYDPELF